MNWKLLNWWAHRVVTSTTRSSYRSLCRCRYWCQQYSVSSWIMCVVGQNALSATLQVKQIWEKWLTDQVDLQQSRETWDAGVSGWLTETSKSSTNLNGKPFFCLRNKHKHQHRLETDRLESTLSKNILGIQTVHERAKWKRMPTASWAELVNVLPESQVKWFFASSWHWQDPSDCGFPEGFPSSGETWT